MGLMGAFESKIEITTKEYKDLLADHVKLEGMRFLLCGSFTEKDAQELKAYRATGITPDRFRVIDEEYNALSKRVNELKKELDLQYATVKMQKDDIEKKDKLIVVLSNRVKELVKEKEAAEAPGYTASVLKTDPNNAQI